MNEYIASPMGMRIVSLTKPVGLKKQNVSVAASDLNRQTNGTLWAGHGRTILNLLVRKPRSRSVNRIPRVKSMQHRTRHDKLLFCWSLDKVDQMETVKTLTE